MKSNSELSLNYVLKDESGYAERDTEGGGAVNMGVTFTVFEAWRRGKSMPMPTFADLKGMTQEEATEIYTAQYLKGISFDDLPIGVDYVVLDAAVNGGVTGSLRLLQESLGVKPVDGHFGVVTKWAVNHRNAPELISKFCAARLAKYKTFKRFMTPYKDGATKTWGDIWSSRIKVVEKRALAMTGKPSAIPASLPLLTGMKPVGKGAMQGLVRRGFTPDQFRSYLEKEVAPQMTAWRPRGVVLHNTGTMKWPGVTPAGKTITPEQRLENMSVDWVNRKFNGGPHLVIAPDGMIWCAWPLWKQGTHSPSFNASYWGVEMVGDFRTEPFPQALGLAAVSACASLLSMIGRMSTDDSVKFHLEDPRTSHKQCPGKNVGAKAQWVKKIGDSMSAMSPGDLGHAA